MKLAKYKELVKQLGGKKLPDAVYIHKSMLGDIPWELDELLGEAQMKFSGLTANNVYKFSKSEIKVSLLWYPDFSKYAYPSLAECRTVNFETGKTNFIDYSKRANPPILHRKETMVPSWFPHIGEFKKRTAEGEAIGLYENTHTIGTVNGWNTLISSKGYYLDKDGKLIDRAIPV